MAKIKVILENAISIATKNGFPDPFLNHTIGFYLDGKNYYSIIFDKYFASSVWKKEEEKVVFKRLQEMILSDEPLKYLEKTLK